MAQGPGYQIRKEKVVYRVIGEELVLLETETGRCYSLNKTGTVIWKELERDRGIQEISGKFAALFPADETRLQTDVSGFCRKLAREGLLSTRDRAAGAQSLPPREKPGKEAVKYPERYEPPRMERYDEIRRGRSVA